MVIAGGNHFEHDVQLLDKPAENVYNSNRKWKRVVLKTKHFARRFDRRTRCVLFYNKWG